MTAAETPASNIHVARWEELAPAIFYAILKLRSDIFVVEQQCAYVDMDGRDIEPNARHVWIDDNGDIACALRLLDDGGGVHRIGRVVTDAAHRHRGLAGRLMRHAIGLAGPPIVVSAQAHLAPWYSTFGFRENGAEWIEDGIAHLPMRLDAR